MVAWYSRSLSARADPTSLEGEAYGRAVVKGPLHLVSLTAARLRELEQRDQLLAVDARHFELEPHCRRIARVDVLVATAAVSRVEQIAVFVVSHRCVSGRESHK
jgi:hypothetical protein